MPKFGRDGQNSLTLSLRYKMSRVLHLPHYKTIHNKTNKSAAVSSVITKRAFTHRSNIFLLRQNQVSLLNVNRNCTSYVTCEERVKERPPPTPFLSIFVFSIFQNFFKAHPLIIYMQYIRPFPIFPHHLISLYKQNDCLNVKNYKRHLACLE